MIFAVELLGVSSLAFAAAGLDLVLAIVSVSVYKVLPRLMTKQAAKSFDHWVVVKSDIPDICRCSVVPLVEGSCRCPQPKGCKVDVGPFQHLNAAL